MKKLQNANDYKSLFAEFLAVAGVDEKMLKKYLNKEYPQPGDFLLKDGSYQNGTKYNEEAGIYFSPNLYLNLIAFSKTPNKKFVARDVEGWCNIQEVQLPTLEELTTLQQQVKAVNSSLCDAGMGDFLLQADLISQCWYQEILHNPQKAKETRRIIPIGCKENVPNAVAFMAKLQPLFQEQK